MSLINEALKKAQRQRLEGAATGAPGTDANGPIAKRPQPKSAKSTLMLVVGAVVLIVASMVATALYVARPSAPAAPAKKPEVAAAPAPAAELPAISPAITLPVSAPAPAVTPATKEPVTNSKRAAATAPSSPTMPPAGTSSNAPDVALIKPAPSSATPSPAATAPSDTTALAATEATPPKPAAKPDERIHQFVESVRVMGIRSSGTDSKVLMNDRVYRVNDIVDRNLGVRLTKVASDSLTFTDANGVTYVKYF